MQIILQFVLVEESSSFKAWTEFLFGLLFACSYFRSGLEDCRPQTSRLDKINKIITKFMLESFPSIFGYEDITLGNKTAL